MESKSKTRWVLLPIVISLVLSGCGSKKDLLSSDLLPIEDNAYVSSEAVIGDLEKKETVDAAAYYPVVQDLTPAADAVVLESMEVDNLDTVKEGDLLAKLRPYSEEEIAEKEQAIAAKEAEYNRQSAYYARERDQLNAQYASADAYDRAIITQKLAANEINNNYMATENQTEIDQMKKELETMKAVQGDCNIYAPFDGVVDNVFIRTEGTVLTSQSVVLRMHSTDTVVVYFDDPGYTYFGNTVTILAGSGDKQQKIQGTVVCADHYLPDLLKQGKVYVRLDGEYDKSNLDPLKAELATYRAGQVLMTKSSGVFTIKDKSYVFILEDGELRRRHVLTGGSDGENTWILQGIDEHDVVYLQ